MLNSERFFEKILEGWEAEQSSNGVPYFVNHETERTQWDHPFYAKTIEELVDFDNIKYAAYRTAMKIRFLQKRFCFDLVDIRLLSTTLERHGLDDVCLGTVTCSVLEGIIKDIMEGCYKPDTMAQLTNCDPALMAQLILNWLLDLYDSGRAGEIRISAVKVALATLSSARLTEKYKYIFKQLKNKNSRIDRECMEQCLQDLIRISDLIQESSSFGGINVRPAVDSCFSQAWSGTLGVSEDEFVAWLLKEPQTVVWLPTMHRLAAAETVQHEVKCQTCRAFPVVGLRYKCLKCFNYDLCQQCFFTGKVNKSHKVKHPTQEYCLNTTKKEDTKAFLRTVRNNFSKKHRNKRKPRYLPIHYTGQTPQTIAKDTPNPPGVREEADNNSVNTEPIIPQNVVQSYTQQPYGPGILDVDERRELANIIQHLEHENRELMHELECIHSHPPSTHSPAYSDVENDDEDSDPSDWIERDKLDAKQEIIEAHNRQLQLQLTRLRALLHKEGIEDSNTEPLAPLSVNIPYELSSNHLANEYRKTDTNQLSLYQNQPHMKPYNKNSLFTFDQNHNMDSFHNTPRSKKQHRRSCTPKLHSTSNEHTPRLSEYHQHFGTPDSLGSLGINTTTGSDDLTLGRTHFSLPSPPNMKHYPEEEAQLAELMAKLDNAGPLDMSREELSMREGAMHEMLLAANQIGEAFSGLVTNTRPSEIAALEKDYESTA